MQQAARQLFWSRTKQLTLGLLAVWLTINLSVPWFARAIADVQVLGFPLGYWLAAEGMLLLYLTLIVVYVVVMERLEASYLRSLEAAARAARVAAEGDTTKGTPPGAGPPA